MMRPSSLLWSRQSRLLGLGEESVFTNFSKMMPKYGKHTNSFLSIRNGRSFCDQLVRFSACSASLCFLPNLLILSLMETMYDCLVTLLLIFLKSTTLLHWQRQARTRKFKLLMQIVCCQNGDQSQLDLFYSMTVYFNHGRTKY